MGVFHGISALVLATTLNRSFALRLKLGTL